VERSVATAELSSDHDALLDAVDDWSTTSRSVGRLAFGIHGLSLAGSVILLAALDRRLWFFGDDWDFIVDRGLSNARFNLLYPHSGEHWSTLPILLWRALFAIDGARHYWVYLLPTLLAHAALGHVLWRVALRAGASAWLTTSLVALFLLDGAIFENITWAFQIGFIAPVLLGWWAILLTTSPPTNRRRDLTAILLLTAGLMCSGIGVTMTVVAGLCVLVARNWRAALAVVIVPAVVQLCWLYFVGLRHYGADASHSIFHDLTLFVGTGLSNAGEKTLGVPGLGAAAVVGLIGWAVLQIRAAQVRTSLAAPVGGVLGIVILYLIISTGRSFGGLAASEASRYIYIATALALPGIACALTQLARAHQVPRIVGLALASILGIHLVATLHENLGVRAQQVLSDKLRLDAAIQLVQSGAPILNAPADPAQSGPLKASDLARLVRQGDLPQPKPVPHSVLVREATILQTSITLAPLRAMNGQILATASLVSAPAPNGCLTIRSTGGVPQIALRVQQSGTSVAITVSDGGMVQIDLSAIDPENPAQQTSMVAPGQTVYANFATTLGTPRIVLPASGSTRLCLTPQ
jgi:hypothetical protein